MVVVLVLGVIGLFLLGCVPKGEATKYGPTADTEQMPGSGFPADTTQLPTDTSKQQKETEKKQPQIQIKPKIIPMNQKCGEGYTENRDYERNEIICTPTLGCVIGQSRCSKNKQRLEVCVPRKNNNQVGMWRKIKCYAENIEINGKKVPSLCTDDISDVAPFCSKCDKRLIAGKCLQAHSEENIQSLSDYLKQEARKVGVQILKCDPETGEPVIEDCPENMYCKPLPRGAVSYLHPGRMVRCEASELRAA